MKIAFIITSWDFGGAEVQVLALARAMQKRKHQVLIIAMIAPNNEFLKKNTDVTVQSLQMQRGFPDFRAIFRFKKTLQSFNPDVLHAHMIHAVILARLTRIFVKIPRLISTAHNINEGGKLRELMYRYTDRLSDINTNVSQAGLDLYLEKHIFIQQKNSFFIPNGIVFPNNELETTESKRYQALDIAEKNFVFLAIGRLEEAKDYSNLFKAAKILQDAKHSFKVLIAGSGSLQSQLETQLKTLRLEKTVKLLGRRNDIPTLLQFADAFVMSSAWEGLPIAILEAVSYKLPAVVTSVGGCNEVINNANGYIVPSKNEKALADAMLTLMQLSNQERTILANKAYEQAKEKYELEQVVNQWLKIYSR